MRLGQAEMNPALIVFLLLFLFSCDSGQEWRDEPYQVIWVDTGNNRTLNYEIDDNLSIQRVEAEVIAVGSDQKYVVAKQRLIGNEDIWYFYIERDKDQMYLNSDEITQGPFSESRYQQLKQELSLPGFSKEFY